jgi:hypothetical protein
VGNTEVDAGEVGNGSEYAQTKQQGDQKPLAEEFDSFVGSISGRFKREDQIFLTVLRIEWGVILPKELPRLRIKPHF